MSGGPKIPNDFDRVAFLVDYVPRERLVAAEACARLLRDHLTGDGGFGGKPKLLDCAGCRDAVEAWERTAHIDGEVCDG